MTDNPLRSTVVDALIVGLAISFVAGLVTAAILIVALLSDVGTH
jgi:hypothetical protein